MQPWNTPFDDLSDTNCLVYGLAHGSQRYLLNFLFLKQRGGVRNRAPHFPLCGDTNFIFFDGVFGLV